MTESVERSGTLSELLSRRAALARGAETGIRFLNRRGGEEFHSWRTIEERSGRVASQLAHLGVQRGDRVALVYSTCVEFFHAFFGVLRAGAVPTPLYPPVRLGRFEEYVERTGGLIGSVGACLVLAEGRVARLLGESVKRAAPRFGCLRLDQLAPVDSSKVSELGYGAGHDLGLIQFSSGTTVDPKPVALSQAALLAQTRILNAQWPSESDFNEAGVSWLPLYHDMGLIGCIFPALERPGTITLLPPELFVVRPASWLQAISRYKASVSPAPNFAYGLAVEKIRDNELDGVDLSSWRVALNGAEAVSAQVLRDFATRFEKWGFRPEALTPVYGLSEASLAVTFSPLDRVFQSRSYDRSQLLDRGVGERSSEEDAIELVSVGSPLDEFDVEVRDEEGVALPELSVGRVWVRGPSLMSGYFGNDELTRGALQEGWLDTGDRGFCDEGELFLCGRLKDVLIIRGRNYAPELLEQAASAIDGVRTGCVVACSNRRFDGGDSDEVILFAEVRDGEASDPTALEAASSESVLGASGVLVDRVVLLAPGTLPRTSSGKLRRAETLRQFLSGELVPPQRFGPLRMGAALLRSRRAMRSANARDARSEGET